MPGMMTQAQLMTEVRAALGNRVDSQITDLRVVNNLNLAQQRISRFYPFPELRADWVATSVYTGNPIIDKWLVLPPNVRVIHSFLLQDDANSRKMTEKPWRQFDYNVPLPEFIAPNWPSFYTRFDLNVVMLFPVPLKAFFYFLRATMLPTPFTNVNPTTSTQLSDFVDKDDIIIDLAVSRFWKSLGRIDLSKEAEADAIVRMREAQANAEDHPDMSYAPSDMAGSFAGTSGGEYWANPFIMGVN